MLRGTLLDNSLAIGSDQLFHFFKKRRQRGLGVGCDEQIGLRRVSIDVEVVSGQQLERADVDGLRTIVCRVLAESTAATGSFQTQNEIRLTCAVPGEGMPVREVHAVSSHIDGRP